MSHSLLYIAGQKNYHGVLTHSECDSSDLWSEMMDQTEDMIQKSLLNWRNRNNEKDKDLNNMIPFRIIMHKVRNFKMVHSPRNYPFGHAMKGRSKNNYFALMWIPTNPPNGMNEEEICSFIKALRNSNYLYFCNKLNEDSVYISGPEYDSMDGHEFDLDSITDTCQTILCQTLPTKIIDIEIAVHELARETFCSENEFVDQKKQQNSNIQASNVYSPLIGSLNRSHPSSGFMSPLRNRVNKYVTEPKQVNALGEIYHGKSALSLENPVFAIVWFHVIDRDGGASDGGASVHIGPNDNDNEPDDHEAVAITISVSNDNIFGHAPIDGELPALSIMKLLHLQPYNASRAYNVEIFGYDDCYENLDLEVDRKIMFLDAFLLFLQFMMLPFAILCPPIKMMRDFERTPRYRPVSYYNADKIPENMRELLDRTEKIPYDICQLWWPFVDKRSKCFCEWKFRFLSFCIAFPMYAIVLIGPIIYIRLREDHLSQLLFFDCYGPALFYGLTVCTIIWWSCATRVFILPKEHELLYYKLIANRPMRRKKGNKYTPRTDWAALTNISDSTLLTTYIYAYRKGFFEIRTPTHALLSIRPFKCCGGSWKRPIIKTVLTIVVLAVYFLTYHLEKIQQGMSPFNVPKDDRYYQLKLAYFIPSSIFSLCFVFGFILLWETMFERMSRHMDNVRTLSRLIVRNTYSEYIKLSRIDNILSWLALERFVKRKGMMLFASLETPLFSLWVLLICSSGSVIWCIYKGIGSQLFTDNSIFSNSALATWFYLALFAVVQTWRMLWRYGSKFNRETQKQDAAFRSQCGTIQTDNLMQFVINDEPTLEQKRAIKSSQILLQHIVHDEIVPTVFGIKFDKLTSKAFVTIIMSAVPTIIYFLIDQNSTFR